MCRESLIMSHSEFGSWVFLSEFDLPDQKAQKLWASQQELRITRQLLSEQAHVGGCHWAKALELK